MNILEYALTGVVGHAAMAERLTRYRWGAGRCAGTRKVGRVVLLRSVLRDDWHQ